MQEALIGFTVVVVVLVASELMRKRRRPTRCPTCRSESLLVLNDSDVMRECNACGKIFSL